MGIKTLKQYQNDAIEELINYSEKLLKKIEKSKLLYFNRQQVVVKHL
jgi:hypothetical protein